MISKKIRIGKTITTSRLQAPRRYSGVPDKITARKDKLTKGSEVIFSPFEGWVDYPIYKELSEITT